MRLVFLTEEALAVLDDLLDPLPEDVDVGLHEAVLLQQVLHTHQVLPEVVREQAQLQLLHRVQDVQHLLYNFKENASETWRNYADNWGKCRQ
jgi:hypothetical protein